VKREDLLFGLNETTHALRFAEAAAGRFTVDPHQLEAGSTVAASVAYISNRLTDAQTSLTAAIVEIGKLMRETTTD
jgi:hypothetical protein